jgi:hypothetical protein
MRAYPMEEEVEERGVVDGLDLRPAPVVPRPVPYRALRLRGGSRRRRERGGRRRAQAGAEAARKQHRGRAGGQARLAGRRG